MNGKSMTDGQPWKHIIRFAIPILAGSLLQQLYNTVDTIIVGKFYGELNVEAGDDLSVNFLSGTGFPYFIQSGFYVCEPSWLANLNPHSFEPYEKAKSKSIFKEQTRCI